MRPPTDDRAVTVQVGTVLLFGILIVLLSVYQASVVPDQNADVEYNHNQRVHGELQDLRDELRRTAFTGSGGSSSVTLGTQYPVRAFFVNPPSPMGSLGTAPPANATIRNANATGETGDYWNGDPRNFSTRGLVYEPNYHVYQDAPTTVYRSSVLYNRFADANVTLAGQRLVEGNTVSLVAVNGSYNETKSGAATVDLRAVSPATRTVTVRNETDEPVTLIVPTKLSVTEWEELLESELDPEEDDPDKYVAAVEGVDGRDAVRVVLEPGVYELEMAKVGIGTDVTPTGPHYVTDVRGDNASVTEGSTQKLVVEVRDRFNNPVSNARVNISLHSSESNDTLVYRGQSNRSFTDLRTDAEGRVAVRYEAAESNNTTREAEVNVSIADVPNGQFDARAKENATFDLQVYSVGDSDDPPSIEMFNVTDESVCDRNPGGQCRGNSESAEYNITWDVTDTDLQSVTVYVNQSGTTVATYTGSSGNRTFNESGAYGEYYTITLVATDAEGNRVCERFSGTANNQTDETRSSC